jgi:predicted N-acetyltransferase YhbS
MIDADVRPMRDVDVPVAQEVAYNSLRDAGRSFGWEMPELDDDARQRGMRRISHALEHDPEGAFVADLDGRIVGVGLATRREHLWFLSLLAVATDTQSQGIGRRLLEATMGRLHGSGALCASSDPKALRRYRRAGFDLIPAYDATGPLDRALIPSADGVRLGSYDTDRDFVERIARLQRGAPHGPDVDYFAAEGWRLFVIDTAAGQGYVVCRDFGPAVLGASSPLAAARLLWTALAEATKPIEISWMSHDQQWALDVALDARLRLRPGGSRCVQGAVGAMSPYIPSGAWG